MTQPEDAKPGPEQSWWQVAPAGDPSPTPPAESPTEQLGWPGAGGAFGPPPPPPVGERAEPHTVFLGSADEPPSEPAPAARRKNAALSSVGLLLAGLLVGGVAVWAVQSQNSDASTTGATPHTGQGLPGGQGGAAPNGTGQNGFGPGPGGSGLAGEQRLAGTITAVGSSTVTLRSQAGTATYTVVADTEIVRNGSQVALSALKAGDVALVHVYPSGSTLVVERILAGTLPGRGGFGGPPGQGAPSGTATGSTTTT